MFDIKAVLYLETILRKALQDANQRILVNGERFYNIRYVNDAIVFTDSIDGNC